MVQALTNLPTEHKHNTLFFKLFVKEISFVDCNVDCHLW